MGVFEETRFRNRLSETGPVDSALRLLPLRAFEARTSACKAFEPSLDEEIVMQVRLQPQGFGFIIAGLCTALLMFSGVASAQLDKQETKCANSINKGAAKVAKAQAGDNNACIKNYGKGKILSAEDCITSDPKGKVAKAISKIKTGDCSGAPSFLPGLETSSGTIGTIMRAKDLDLIHDIFGTDLDVFIVDAGVDKAGAGCQAAVAKAAGKCQDAKLGSFNSCKKDKLKAGDTDIDACLGSGTGGIPDGKGKIAKKCGGDFGLAKKCTGTTSPLDALIPGCAPGVTAACIDQKIECRVCRALNALDGLNRNCDEFDDGVENGSCSIITRGPYLQMPGPDQMLVVWHTEVSLADPTVEYGTTQALGTPVIGNSVPATDPNGLPNHFKHTVQLSGLTPNTKYFYSAGSAEGAFTTSPPHGTVQPVRIWTFGDSGYWPGIAFSICCPENHEPNAYEKTRNAYYDYAGGGDVNAAADATDVMLYLGDNAYTFGDDVTYQKVFFGPPQLQAWLQLQPFFSAAGNHEGAAVGFDSVDQTGEYFDMFYFPQANELGTNGVASGSEAYYSFDYANIHFVILDSEEHIENPDPNAFATAAMLTWLENDLLATTADWIIAAWHRPPYSKGIAHDSDIETNEIGMREDIVPVLEDHGVDLVLSGHSHTYERSGLLDGHYGFSASFNAGTHFLDPGDGDPNGDGAYAKPTAGQGPHEGTVYVVAGSPADVRNFNPGPHPAMLRSLEEIGTAVIEVEGDTLVGKFINGSGTISDTFQIDKGP